MPLDTARARRGRAAGTRRAHAAAPTPAGIVTRAAARAHGDDGRATTGSSCLPENARSHNSRRTSSGRL